MKKKAVMIYRAFCMQEISCLTDWLVGLGKPMIVCAADHQPVKTEEGFTVLPEFSYDEVNLDEIDCLILPGISEFPEVLKDQRQLDFLARFKAVSYTHLFGAVALAAYLTTVLWPSRSQPVQTVSGSGGGGDMVPVSYTHLPLPQEVIVPLELDIEALQEVITCKLIQPVKGYRKKLLDMASNNAKTNLLQKFEVMERQNETTEESMRQLAQKLRIPGLSRIEIFDNSHISGAFTVAGMVVFEDGLPCKNDYRLFKLHTENSDVDSMKEVLYRRYFRLLNEGGRFPDLLLVDGGLTQIEAAKEILGSLDLDIPICGLVQNDKHQTASLMNERLEIVDVEPGSPLFFLLTRMQDEVHRFADVYKRQAGRRLYASGTHSGGRSCPRCQRRAGVSEIRGAALQGNP